MGKQNIVNTKGVKAGPKVVDIFDEYKGQLRIDLRSLDDELVTFSDTYLKVATHTSESQGAAETAKVNLDRAYAETYLRIRLDAEALGTKVTEAMLNSQILVDAQYVEVQKAQQQAKETAVNWVNLRDAMQIKAKMLRELCQLVISGWLGVRDFPDVDLANVGISDSKTTKAKSIVYAQARRAESDSRRANNASKT
jgi:hypothetical protein